MDADINIPGYEIDQLIGAGGMSRVFLARQSSLNRMVAIKVLSEELAHDTEFKDRFIREARSLAQLSHPNILTIYDVASHEDYYYIATEYLSGDDLSHRITAGISTEVAVSITISIARALSYAHDKGFLHRDVKPSNIMFRVDGTPVLVDFGIAVNSTRETTRLTQVGMAVGTPTYSSPEQLRGERADQRSDFYSLGVVFFEMLTAQTPYASDDAFSVALMHMNEPIPQLPRSLQAYQPAINSLLAKSPDDRIGNADELISMLNSIGYVSKPGAISRAFRWLSSALLGKKSDSEKPASDKTSYSLSAIEPKESEKDQRGRDSPGSVNRWQEENGHDGKDSSTRIFKFDEDYMLGRSETEEHEEPTQDGTYLFPVPGVGSRKIPVSLIVVSCSSPELEGIRADINHTPFVVGRDPTADLYIPDKVLSRRHFIIESSEEGYNITDTSTNGVFVNGRRLVANTAEPLLFGDTILLSENTTLKFNARIEILPDLTGTLFAGRYNLTKQLHASIKACTYIAEDKKLPRTVALKLFSPSLGEIPQYARIFRQQAEIAAQLTHPYIASVLDTDTTSINVNGRYEDVQYLCMAQMLGGNLGDKMKHDSPQDLKLVLKWLTTIVDALTYAHNAGFVHSSLKPSAIVFDNLDNPYIADFALARKVDSDSEAAILGSPAFLAPEQWENEPLTPAADQYSLAVLAYLMVSGSLPFERQSDPEVRRRNYLREPIPVHEEAARNGALNVPPALSKVLSKALSVNPNDRYESVVVFLEALVNAATGTSMSSKPRVFVSYQRETSSGWALLFQKELKAKYDIDTYVDAQAIDQAARFPERLAKAIADSDVIVCLLGETTLDSEWVREEIRLANAHNKPMIPVFQERFDLQAAVNDMPDHLQTLLHYDGVYLLDQRNIHVDFSIRQVAEIVMNTFSASR